MFLRASWSSTVAAIGLLLGAAACSPEGALVDLYEPLGVLEDGPVQPIVQVESAAPGSSVVVLFQNTVGHEFWFNPCERFVERRESGIWIRLPDELRICNAMAYILPASADREELVDVPLDVGPGTYRFVFVMRPPRTGDVSHYPASTSFLVP